MLSNILFVWELFNCSIFIRLEDNAFEAAFDRVMPVKIKSCEANLSLLLM